MMTNFVTNPARITKTSMLTGITRTITLPVYTSDEFEKRLIAWKSGMLLQDAFPDLNDAEREFIKSGITDEEWNKAFGNDAEEKVSAFFR